MRHSSVNFGPGSKVHFHLALDASGGPSPPVEIRNASVGDVAIEDALWARRSQAIVQAQEAMSLSAEFMLSADRCGDREKKLIYEQAAKLEKEKAKRLWSDTVIGYNGQLMHIFSADKNFDPGQTIDKMVDEGREKARIKEPEDGPTAVSSPTTTGSSTEAASASPSTAKIAAPRQAA